MSAELERWLPIVGYEGRYEVSDLGRVRSVRQPGAHTAGKLLRGEVDQDGYRRVRLYHRGVSRKRGVHQLVLETFVGACQPGLECCHSNGIRLDNSLGNLRWGTRTSNARDRDLHGTSPKGERNPAAKLEPGDIATVFELRAAGWTLKAIGDRLGVSFSHVGNILAGREWPHLRGAP